MKLYPDKNTNNIRLIQGDINIETDMPLAYVDTSTIEYNTSIALEDTFAIDSKDFVAPYTKFQNADIILFDKNNNEINESTNLFVDNTGKFVFMPKDLIEFDPQKFSYSVLAKKKLEYKTNVNYNLKIGIAGDDENHTFAKSLMPVFSDAPIRGVCPNNISINGQDDYTSFSNGDLKTYDFLFMKSNITEVINDSLNENTNVWLGLDTDINLIIYNQPLSCTISKSITTVQTEFLCNKLFNIIGIQDTIESGVIIHNMFNELLVPIIILEYPNRGFVIKTSNLFFDEISDIDNIALLYETLTYIYNQSYIKSEPQSYWITDNILDYYIIDNQLTIATDANRSISVDKILNMSKDDIKVISIDDVSSANIITNYDERTNSIIFNKSIDAEYNSLKDPIKKENYLSIYTPQNTIVYFEKSAFTIQESLNNKILIKTNPITQTAQIIINPFKNSWNNLNVINHITFEIDIPINEKQTQFVIYSKDKIIQNPININDMNGNVVYDSLIAKIIFKQSNNNIKIYDARKHGGGLPENAPDNFDVFDIGSSYGRAYRKAGTMIITLPKRLEEYNDIITDAINQNMNAEDLPIIIYK